MIWLTFYKENQMKIIMSVFGILLLCLVATTNHTYAEEFCESSKMAPDLISKAPIQYGKYICTVCELQGVDEDESRDFGIKNGKLKKEDQDEYKIDLNERKLTFLNTSNNVEAAFFYESIEDGYRTYSDGPYSFSVSMTSDDFIFHVLKMNYSVQYIGACKPDKGDNIKKQENRLEPSVSKDSTANIPGQTGIDPITGMKFIWVPKGCYQMGSVSGDSREHPVNEVCLDGFWMGKYEVTQGQWKKVMKSNPSDPQSGDRFPVTNVSWIDTKSFISELNRQSGNIFRLPLEAEWEYAARSEGKDQKYAGGNDRASVGWNRYNSGDRSHPVGTKAPNDLGLYDMSGNISEWCEESLNHENSRYTSIRGDSWLFYFVELNEFVTDSLGFDANIGTGTIGFRLAISDPDFKEIGPKSVLNRTNKFEDTLKKAERGEAEAQYNLGIMYQFGKEVKQDQKLATYWYTKSAEQGHQFAQHFLGGMYLSGKGVPQNYKQAFYWYEKSAKQGWAPAQHFIGLMYSKGKGTPQDYNQAIHWLKKATEQGYTNALPVLADIYYSGVGVPQNYEEAFFWYKQAAEQRYPSAQYCLGLMYYFGRGVQKDYKQAIYWYEKAAKQGHAKAQLNLGSMYCMGQGVNKDYKQGYIWFSLAVTQDNNKNVIGNRDKAAKKLSPHELLEAQKLAANIQYKIDHPDDKPNSTNFTSIPSPEDSLKLPIEPPSNQYGESINVNDSDSIQKQFKEVDTIFTLNGKHIHPKLVEEFQELLSDSGCPITTEVDVLEAQGTNKYYENEVIVDGRRIRYKSEENSFSYEWLGRLKNGLHVLRTATWTGGSGVFIDLMFVNFSTNIGLKEHLNSDKQIQSYDRIVMKIIMNYGLGDRFSGEIKILSEENKVIAQYEKEEKVLNLSDSSLWSKRMARSASAQKSDHIIFDSFDDWSVRHVFDQETLEYKYSDAKTTLVMQDGRKVEFQVNKSNTDDPVDYILNGWLDKVIIRVSGKEFIATQNSMHTFYGKADKELLNAIANSNDRIEIEAIQDGKSYIGSISPKGSSAALRWIRAIE